MVRARVVVWLTLAAAVAVFCVVQDRVTAAGARRYVALQRAAIESGGAPLDVQSAMAPAIRQSVRSGALWGGLVLLVGLGAAVMLRRSGVRG